MHPGSGHIERVASEDDTIPLRFPVKTPSGATITSIPVKAGQTIYVPVAAADRLKCVWGEDADVWRPQRWIEEGGLPDPSVMNSGYARLFAFSQGARACIGLRLAVYQVKVRVELLLKKLPLLTMILRVTVRYLPYDSHVQGKRHRCRNCAQE